MSPRNIEAKDYDLFSKYLANQCGIVLGSNKQYLVKSRLSPLLKQYASPSLSELIGRVLQGREPRLNASVIDAMTTNETLWFRDGYPFELLQKELLPALSGVNRRLRIWSAACSSGQEPYSIAMAILEYQRQNPGKLSKGVEIIGTDLSSEMLERCKKAEYDAFSLSRGLSEQRKSQFFEPASDGQLRLSRKVTQMVSFRQLNLLGSYAMLGTFDIVFCRNVLIYFSAEVKTKILQQIAASLQKEGVLLLGASESISGLTDKFHMVRATPGLYYRKKP